MFIKTGHLHLTYVFPIVVVVMVLFSQSRSPGFKPSSGSKVNSSFHPSEVDEMRTRNFWELMG